MNINLFLLALIAFLAGLTEFVISGILPFIADYYHVSTQQAGYLVTMFAFIFAIAGPILMGVTSRFSRRSLLLIFMVIFIVGNVLSVISMNYSLIMLSRIILAFSVSMLIGLAFSLSVKVVEPHQQPKAIGLTLMAISSAMVLGSPIGIFLSTTIGWKAIFVIIAGLSVICLLLIYRYFPHNIESEPVSFKSDWRGFVRKELLIAHLYSFLFFTGQSIFYIYFTPFLMDREVDTGWISILYIVFGISGTLGSGLGGILTEKIGSKKSIVLLSGLYVLTMAGFLLSSSIIGLIINTALLGLIGWSNNAPTQTYLINTAPKYASINQTVSTSAVQFGISFGALIGGWMISHLHSFNILVISATFVLMITVIIAVLLYKISNGKLVDPSDR